MEEGSGEWRMEEYFYCRTENWYTVKQLFEGLKDRSICPLTNSPVGGIIIDENVVPSELGYVVACLRNTIYYVDKAGNPVSQEVLLNCLRELRTVRMGGTRGPVCHVNIELDSDHGIQDL